MNVLFLNIPSLKVEKVMAKKRRLKYATFR